MNRYSNYSPSAYDPLSLQEIMMVPAMKRLQHDKLNEYLMNEQGLIKPDPLDVHYNEAMQIKNQTDQKIAQQADELATKGFNSNIASSIRNTNRDIQNLIAPTGRIGQINNAKQVYLTEQKNYLDNAEKNGVPRDAALLNWAQIHKPGYSGYDERGNIINIGSYGAPNKQDFEEDIAKAHAILGSTENGAAAHGYHVINRPDGSMIFADASGNITTKTNIPQLDEALQAFNAKWFNPNGEGFKYALHSRMDMNNLANRANHSFNAMSETSRNDTRDYDYGYNQPDKSKTDEIPDLEAVNVEGVDITKNTNLLDRLNGKDSRLQGAGFAGSTAGTFKSRDLNTIIKETTSSPEYKQLAYGVIKRDPKLAGKTYDSKEVQNAVKSYLSENKDVTLQNRYVDPNTNKNAFLFASKEIGKDKTATSNLILERAQQGAYEIRDEDGKLIDPVDLGKYNFTYSGDMTPKSQLLAKNNKPIFANPKQNIGARRGILVDKNSNETKKVYISRSSDDFDTPQFKALETINAISKVTDTQPGIVHRINGELFKQYGMKNVEIKYNKNKGTYDMSYTDSNGQPIDVNNIPDEKFQQTILEDYNQLYQ